MSYSYILASFFRPGYVQVVVLNYHRQSIENSIGNHEPGELIDGAFANLKKGGLLVLFLML